MSRIGILSIIRGNIHLLSVVISKNAPFYPPNKTLSLPRTYPRSDFRSSLSSKQRSIAANFKFKMRKRRSCDTHLLN